MKKGEMGVGTLIVLIAVLLVAAVAAGVLIQTSHSLQEKSFAVGSDSESQISTNIQVITIYATDGRDTNLTYFEEIFKLSPGSGPIKLEDTIIKFNTIDITGTLKYRGINSVCEKNNQNGYNTKREEEFGEVDTSTTVTLDEDLDDDMIDDYLYIDDATIFINLSSQSLINISMNDISNASGTAVPINIQNRAVSNGSYTFAYLTLIGTTDQNHTLIDNMTFTLVPEAQILYNGYFSAIYENEGTNHAEGKVQQGDVLRMCYEAPRDITEDESVRIGIIPKVGTPTMSYFYTPQAIGDFTVFLYP